MSKIKGFTSQYCHKENVELFFLDHGFKVEDMREISSKFILPQKKEPVDYNRNGNGSNQWEKKESQPYKPHCNKQRLSIKTKECADILQDESNYHGE